MVVVSGVKSQRRKAVREWSYQLRQLGKYHQDRCDEALLENSGYQTDTKEYASLHEQFGKLVEHPEYHY